MRNGKAGRSNTPGLIHYQRRVSDPVQSYPVHGDERKSNVIRFSDMIGGCANVRTLPLDTPFELPDWFEFTACWWNFGCSDGGSKRDRDGQKIGHRYTSKKFAARGGVDGYRFGSKPPPLRDMEYTFGPGCKHERRAQLGLVCSPQARFIVAEADDAERFAANNLPIHGNVLSGSGRGEHCYIAVPPELAHLVPTDGPIPGGDVQSAGFVPAPGSVHPGGGVYAITNPVMNVATEALLLRLAELRREHKVERASGSGGGTHTAGDGQDDHMFTWTQATMRRLRIGRSPELKQLWLEEIARMPLLRPDEPWTDADYERHSRDTGQDASWRLDPEQIDDVVLGWVESLKKHDPDAGYTAEEQAVLHEIPVIGDAPFYVTGVRKQVMWPSLAAMDPDKQRGALLTLAKMEGDRHEVAAVNWKGHEKLRDRWVSQLELLTYDGRAVIPAADYLAAYSLEETQELVRRNRIARDTNGDVCIIGIGAGPSTDWRTDDGGTAYNDEKTVMAAVLHIVGWASMLGWGLSSPKIARIINWNKTFFGLTPGVSRDVSDVRVRQLRKKLREMGMLEREFDGHRHLTGHVGAYMPPVDQVAEEHREAVFDQIRSEFTNKSEELSVNMPATSADAPESTGDALITVGRALFAPYVKPMYRRYWSNQRKVQALEQEFVRYVADNAGSGRRR